MNEFLFFSHAFLLLIFLLISLRIGKKALVSFIVAMAIFSNLFVIKQIDIFGFSASSADVYVSLLIIALNILQEYFGKKDAKKAVNISFLFLALFVITSKIHLLYLPSAFDRANSSFNTIFSSTPRIVLTSFLVFFVITKLDLFFYSFVRKIFSSYLVFSMIVTTIVIQLLDTVLFCYIGLYGVLENLHEVMFVGFLIKAITVFLSTGFIYFSKNILKKPKTLKHEIF